MTGGRIGIQMVLAVTGIIIPRVMGVETYGLFASVMAVVIMLQSASVCGLDLIEIRHLAPAWQAGERPQSDVLASSVWTTRLALSVMAAVVAGVWLALSRSLELGLAMCLVVALYAVLRYAGEATRGLFLALGQATKLTTLELTRAVASLPFIVGSFLLFGQLGAFGSLAVVSAAVLALGYRWMVRLLDLRPGLFRWSVLRPHLGYSLAAIPGTLAGVVQAQFSIYLVAASVARSEAGYLAVAVQFYLLCQGLFVTALMSLMPILAELERHGQIQRLRMWGSLMMRSSAASSCLAALGWAFVGRQVVSWLLTDAYAPVYHCVMLITVGMACYFGGSICSTILTIRGRSGLSSVQSIIYAGVTIAGIVWAVRGETEGTALRISAVYAVAAGAFALSAYFTLGLRERLWLPLRRTLVLIFPTLLVWPVEAWEAGFPSRVAAALLFAALYASLAVGLKLLPADELRELRQAWHG